MKKYLLLVLYLISITVFAQDKKLLLGFSFSPEYSNEQISYISIPNGIKGTFGYSTGLKLLYKIKSRWALETGLVFSNKARKLSLEGYNVWDLNDPYYANLNSTKIKYTSYYLEIPMKVNYYITTGKLKIFISTGISGDLLLLRKSKYTYTYNDGTTEKLIYKSSEKFNAIVLGVQAGLGLEYNVSNRFIMRIEPTYKGQVLNFYRYTTNYFSLGGNFGLFYSL